MKSSEIFHIGKFDKEPLCQCVSVRIVSNILYLLQVMMQHCTQLPPHTTSNNNKLPRPQTPGR